MSINATTSTCLDGLMLGTGALCGFHPHDHDSSYARYERNGVVCGVLYQRLDEGGDARGRLYFYPAYQLPRAARSGQAWKKFIFHLDAEEACGLTLDSRDGEVRCIRTSGAWTTPDAIEEAIDRYVDALTSIYPQVVDFVGRKKALPGRGE